MAVKTDTYLLHKLHETELHAADIVANSTDSWLVFKANHVIQSLRPLFKSYGELKPTSFERTWVWNQTNIINKILQEDKSVNPNLITPLRHLRNYIVGLEQLSLTGKYKEHSNRSRRRYWYRSGDSKAHKESWVTSLTETSLQQSKDALLRMTKYLGTYNITEKDRKHLQVIDKRIQSLSIEDVEDLDVLFRTLYTDDSIERSSIRAAYLKRIRSVLEKNPEWRGESH